MEYSGTYTDKFGTERIVVKNDFKNISFKIGDYKFVSHGFDDFELENYKNYTSEELERFTFRPLDIYNSTNKFYELRDFDICFVVPVVAFRPKNNNSFDATLEIKMIVRSTTSGDSRINLKLNTGQKEYSAESGVFEIAANQINKEINGDFILKNCFWCLYSDYSVYGQGSVGSMICYVKHKDQYLKVKTKDEYMDLPTDNPFVQEIYYYDSFEPRRPEIGYRG